MGVGLCDPRRHKKTPLHSLKLVFQDRPGSPEIICVCFILNLSPLSPPAHFPQILKHTQAFLETLNPQNCNLPHAAVNTH